MPHQDAVSDILTGGLAEGAEVAEETEPPRFSSVGIPNIDIDLLSHWIEEIRDYVKLLNADDLESGVISEDDIDRKIAQERNQSMADLTQVIDDIDEIWSILSSMIYGQGEEIDLVEENVDMAEINTAEGVVELEEAVSLIKDKFIIIRDLMLIMGGGLLGTAGFFLGPIAGIGAVAAGVSVGGAAVVGIHKISDK